MVCKSIREMSELELIFVIHGVEPSFKERGPSPCSCQLELFATGSSGNDAGLPCKTRTDNFSSIFKEATVR